MEEKEEMKRTLHMKMVLTQLGIHKTVKQRTLQKRILSTRLRMVPTTKVE